MLKKPFWRPCLSSSSYIHISTREPHYLPLVTCHVILHCFSKCWNWLVEHRYFIPIYNTISFAFSLTVRPATGIYFTQAQQNPSYNLSSKLLCLASWNLNPFAISAPSRTSDMWTVLRAEFHKFAIFVLLLSFLLTFMSISAFSVIIFPLHFLFF